MALTLGETQPNWLWNNDLSCPWAGCCYRSGPVLSQRYARVVDDEEVQSSRESTSNGWRGPRLWWQGPSWVIPSQVSVAFPKKFPKVWVESWVQDFRWNSKTTLNTEHKAHLFSIFFQVFWIPQNRRLTSSCNANMQHPLILADLPSEQESRPQRLKNLWQATYGGRIYQLCFVFVIFIIAVTAFLWQMRLVSIYGNANGGKNKLKKQDH